jgi:hypothetical protein
MLRIRGALVIGVLATVACASAPAPPATEPPAVTRQPAPAASTGATDDRATDGK